MLKRALIISGALAFVALAAPWLVVLGMFLILPGIILGSAPTVFMYLVGFAIIRRYLPIYEPFYRNIAATALAIGIGWLVAQPSVLLGKFNYMRLHDDDVVGSAPVRLAGHLKLEYVRGYPSLPEGHIYCDKLCAALLRTPGVKSVTMAARQSGDEPTKPRTTWSLAPKGSVPDTGYLLEKPEDIFSDLPSDPVQKKRNRDFSAEISEREARDKSFAADWALRLSTDQTLVRKKPRKKFDMVIKIIDERRLGGVHQRIEVATRESTNFRKTLVRVPVLGAPISYLPEGGIENFRFGWARSSLNNGPAYPDLAPITLLFKHTNLARPKPVSDASERLRKRLAEVLADPAASKSELALAYAWNTSMGYKKASNGVDEQLMASVISDPRIANLQPFLKDLKASPAFRNAAARRILHPATKKEDRLSLASKLYKLPRGTFAEMSAAERAILADPVLRLQAAPFMTRAADAGPQALPEIITWLRELSRPRDESRPAELAEKEAYDRITAIVYPREALERLGLDAAPALTVVLELFGEDGGKLIGYSVSSRGWRVAMARMGLPLERQPWPKRYKADDIAWESKRVKEDLKRYDVYPKED